MFTGTNSDIKHRDSVLYDKNSNIHLLLTEKNENQQILTEREAELNKLLTLEDALHSRAQAHTLSLELIHREKEQVERDLER